MNEAGTVIPCPHCNEPVGTQDRFCGSCGADLKPSSEVTYRRGGDVMHSLLPTFAYYFITLPLLAIFKFTDVFEHGLDGMITISIIDIVIVLAFWALLYKNIEPLFSLRGIQLHIIGMVILGALGGSVVISFVAEIIKVSISDDAFYDTYLFEDTPYPLALSILFICVQPALFEEVTFRGFIFNNIRQVSPLGGTILITGFIFGILHLSVVSLIWLVPIGLALGWLRGRYNTLWYGMIGHFTYNLGIILIDMYR